MIIRKLLLGDLPEEEQARAEKRLLGDDDYFELLSAIEEELIDDYISGELTSEDRERFKAHFLCTPERREKLRFAQTLTEYVSQAPSSEETIPDNVYRPVWWKQALSNPYLRLAAAAVIVIGLGLGIWRAIIYQPEESKGIAALKEAYRDQRPVESRITGFDYAPTPTVTRGGEQEKFDYRARDRAQALIQLEAAEQPSSQSYHDLGRLYLTQHEFDKAIEQFEKALKPDGKNAQIENDLGVALMEKAKAARLKGEGGKSLEDFARALEHFNKALELNGSLFEALFNRALCRQEMGLFQQAEEDWRAYLEKDPNSKWADDARQKLKRLEEQKQNKAQTKEQLYQDFLEIHKARDDGRAWQLISQNRDQTESFIENRLINDYLELAVKGRYSEANELLEALSYIGEVEYQKARDTFIPDLVRFYKSATPSQLERVLQARGLIKRGRESSSTYNYDEALEFYKKAKEIFERAGDECEAMYMAYPIGNCYVQQSKAESALSLFQPLALASEQAQYRRLLARTLNAMSNANQYLRDFSTAINNTNRSLKLSEDTGDIISTVNTRYQLADIYRFINNGRKALDLYARDLSLTQIYLPQPAQQWGNYFSISRIFDQLDHYSAAIDFQREALQLAIKAQAPRLMCRSYNYLGLMLAKQEDYADAINSIERALEIGNSFSDKRVQIEATAYSFLQLGYIYRKTGNFSKAIENYDQAIRLYDELDSKFFVFTARKDKLLCCIEQGECPSVEQEIATMLKLFEEHRTKILEENNRNSFFDAEQSIYDVAIEFEYYKKGDSKRALEYSERSRGRSLRDLASTNVKIIDDPDSPDMEFGDVSQPMSIEEIQAQMPEQAQILQYAVLKNSILIWVVSKDGPFSASQSISIDDLNKKVNNFLQLVSGAARNDTDAFSRESIYLYELLIKPVETRLNINKQLCIVPDKVLNYLPFAALKSQTSGKYFIEEQKRSFVLSPSSTMFVVCSQAAQEKESLKSERLSSVGNPFFNHKAFSDLDELQSATREAKTIASYYKSSPPLIGALATKRRVINEMERANVIHLATHAVADEWSPLRSKLLLASNATGEVADGVLQAYEIYKLDLSRVKLVVLSACRTGVEKYYGGEGMIGLSRPFIAKRIPLVVASLWPVESDTTARLMTSFHSYRKNEGNPTAEALRYAQLEMLGSSNSNDRLPYNWASFVTIGGYASF